MNARRLAFTSIAIVSLAAFGCGDSKKGAENGQAASACTDAAAAVPKPDLQHLTAPTQQLPSGSVWNLEFKTNCGSFTVQVDSSISPKTASSVVSLARSGFYDSLSFHRLAPGFVIQGGDPAGTGNGGPGYKTVDKPAADSAYTRGTVAMAKTGAEKAGTAGSQFFIVTADDAQLPADYAILGKVISGMSTADLISAQEIDQAQSMGGAQDGPPKKPIIIESVKVSRVS